MSANLQLYEQEVISFLQTATIVFSPLAEQTNNNLLARGISVDLTNPETWKYYLNLSGQYHSADVMMTVMSLDTRQLVDFTRETLSTHPKTASVYVVGTSYYADLCQAHPDQTDLIKSIVYPVDLQTAITTPDFTLLGWGNGYLEVTEQDAIINDLQTFINYAVTRWYFSFLNYEVYYAWAFWASLWQALPNAIFAARLKYLHTAKAHSFHIWSYLQSHGIGDYSDILTPQQALFLYRNLQYIIQNKGKQSTLILLVNRLLSSLSVGLVGKTVYMNTLTQADECAWTPEFVSTIIPTLNSQSLEVIAPESMTMINTQLVSAGLDIDNSPAYVAAQQTRIGLTTRNILPTKMVEIQKLGIDEKYGSLLNTFILDTLVWGITSGRFAPTVTVTDPTTKLSVSLSGADALALYYYAVHRSNREQPVSLPRIYAPSCAFLPDITAESFPTQFSFDGRTYPTRSYLSLDMMLEGLGYPSFPIRDPEEFSTMVADQFLVLIRYVRYSRTEGSAITLEMFRHYCNTVVLQTKPYAISLSQEPNYSTWAASLGLQGLIQNLDAQTDYVGAYNDLATAITTLLIPENSPVYNFFSYTAESTDNLYDRLRALFAQLCSYNICFLDTNRVNAWWFLYDRVVYRLPEITDEQNMTISGVVNTEADILQADTMPGTGIMSPHSINVGSDGIEPIKIAETAKVMIGLSGSRPVYSPLTVNIGDPCPLVTTTRIAFDPGVSVVVHTPA